MISLKIKKFKKILLAGGLALTMSACGDSSSVKPEEPTTEKDKTGTTEMNKEFNYLPATEMTSAETETYIADLIKDPENLGSKQIEKKDIKAIPDEETLEDNGLAMIYWYNMSLVKSGEAKQYKEKFSSVPIEEYHSTASITAELEDGSYVENQLMDEDSEFLRVEIVPIVSYGYLDSKSEPERWQKFISVTDNSTGTVTTENIGSVLNREKIDTLYTIMKDNNLKEIKAKDVTPSEPQKTLSK